MCVFWHARCRQTSEGGDSNAKVTLVRRLDGAPVPAAVIPDYYEVWNWEGDDSVLPMKWEAVIQASFAGDGAWAAAAAWVQRRGCGRCWWRCLNCCCGLPCPGCCRLCVTDLAAQWTAEYLSTTFVAKPQFDRHGFFFVTHRSDTVGTAFAWTDDDAPPGVGRVHFVAVHPRHRGKGIGTALVRLVLQRLADRGCTSAVLRTEAKRAAAIKLYTDEGFAPATP